MSEFEPHLTMTVGSYTDLWHRFKKPKRHPKFGVYLTTRCGQEIYDHSNVRSTYNPRIDRFCARCFPFGIEPDGSYKERPTPDASGDGDTPGGEPSNTEGSVPLTSTPEPLVSESDDAGGSGTASEEGSGVLGADDDGHMEELPEQREGGSSSVESSTGEEGGQGKSVRKSGQGSAQRSAAQRKSKDNAS